MLIIEVIFKNLVSCIIRWRCLLPFQSDGSTFTLNAVDSMRTRSIGSVSLELVDWGWIWRRMRGGAYQGYYLTVQNRKWFILIYCAFKYFEFWISFELRSEKGEIQFSLMLPPCLSFCAAAVHLPGGRHKFATFYLYLPNCLKELYREGGTAFSKTKRS